MESAFSSPQHEWWPRPSDGRLVPLVLQTGDEPYLLPETPRWSRIGKVTTRMSPILQVSYWVGSALFVPGTRKYRINIRSLALTAVKLLIAWPLLCILILWTGCHGFAHGGPLGGASDAQESKNTDSLSRYDKIHVQQGEHQVSKDYPAVRTGPLQDSQLSPSPPEADSEVGIGQQYQDNIRLTEASTSSAALGSSHPARAGDDMLASVRPRHLCFVKDFDAGTYETVKVSDYLKQNGDDVDLEFVFVSYTRMQFRVATEEEIAKFPYPDEDTREANRELARRDRELLARWGMDAAKKVGKRAFWLDFECVRNVDGIASSTSSSEDVYRICDIVRAAHSMIIAIGPTTSDKVTSILAGKASPAYSRESVTPWLRQWGSRLWTLPELLLCPGEYRIRLYVAGDPSEPKAMAKRNFAERAWDDAEAVKELVNHFEGSAILTSQHLIEAALTCFSRRQTDQFSQGDIAYATMGLFPSRHRPRVNKNDTGFTAFAKLSLANDSGAFLERLICLAPRPGAPWYQTEDRWDVKLSDIHPNNKVYGVLSSETILLDGVYGATIHWNDRQPESVLDRKSRSFPAVLIGITTWLCFTLPLVYTLCYSVLSLVIYFTNSRLATPSDPFRVIFGCALSAMPVMAVLTPVAMISSRGQPKKPLKPRLIGIEGMVDAGTAEKHLWGYDHGNLELVDTNPLSYRDADDSHEPSSPQLPSPEPGFTFTLVDTYLLTVTHFCSSLPPTAMLICGQEAGWQRTLLCSYDWRTQTFHRQAVLRVKRKGLAQLHMVDRIRFSLAAHPNTNYDGRQSNALPAAADHQQRPAITTLVTPFSKSRWRTWKRGFLFLVICLYALDLKHDPSFLYGRHLGPQIYNLCWVISQILGVGLLSRLPLSLLCSSVFVVKQILEVLEHTFEARLMYYVLYGLVDGFLHLTLVAYTLLWYPIEQVALRFLLWNVIVSGCFQVLRIVFAVQLRNALSLGHGLSMLALVIIQGAGQYDLLGSPKEVAWLSAEQKIKYSDMAASQRLLANMAGSGAAWQQRRSFLTRYAPPLVVLVVSLLHSISTGLVHLFYSLNRVSDLDIIAITLGLLLLAVPVGIISYRLPATSCEYVSWMNNARFMLIFLLNSPVYMLVAFAMAASILQIVGLLGHHESISFQILLQSSAIVPPLLWSVVVRYASTWLEAIGTIALAITGQTVGYILLPNITPGETFMRGIAFCIPMFLTQLTLWALLWACLRADTLRIKLPEVAQPADTTQEP